MTIGIGLRYYVTLGTRDGTERPGDKGWITSDMGQDGDLPSCTLVSSRSIVVPTSLRGGKFPGETTPECPLGIETFEELRKVETLGQSRGMET